MKGAAPAVAQEIKIDYAHDFDFSGVETFQYRDTKESNMADPLMDERIRKAITAELVKGGAREVQENPDIFITYHYLAGTGTVYDSTSYGYGGHGYGWGSFYGGPATSTTMPMNFPEGTLIIDAYEADGKQVIWQGSGTVILKDDPEKRAAQVDKVVKKMADKWHATLERSRSKQKGRKD